MPRIDFNPQELAPTGVPDLAMARPNEAMAQMGQQADAVDQTLEKIQQRDAAMEGAQALADFRLQREKRQQELRTAAKTPDGFVDVALHDFDEHAQQLIDAHQDDRTKMFLEERLLEARDGEGREAIAWQANAMQARSEQLAVDTVNKYANMVNTAPGKFESALSDVNAMIDASGLDLVHADKLRSVSKFTLGRAAIFGLVETKPHLALQQLQSGLWNDYLESDTKISAVNAAQSELKRRESEARANAAMARQEALVSISQWQQDNIASISATGKPVPPPYSPEQMKALLKPAQYEAVVHSTQKANSLFQVVGPMVMQTDAEIAAKVASLEPKPGQEGYKEQQGLHQAAMDAWDAIRKARKSDPASQAMLAYPKLRDKWDFYAAKPAKEHLRDAVKASLNAQAAQGIGDSDQKPLTSNFASFVAGEITNAPPQKAAEALQKWATDFGPYWGKVFQQIAKNLDPHVALAATIKDPNTAAILVETARTANPDGKGGGVEALRKQLGVSTKVQSFIQEDERIRDMTVALSRGQGGMKTAVELSNSVEMLALGLMGRNNLTPEAAADQAIQQFIDKNYSYTYYNSVPTFVPKLNSQGQPIDHRSVETGFEHVVDNLKADNLDLPYDHPGTPKAWTAESYLAAVKSGASYWVTDPGELSATLYIGDHPVTRFGSANKPGKPISVSFGELERLGSSGGNSTLTAPTRDVLRRRVPGAN